MKLTKPESHATHVNVVPMVDVIMCLIIFYMLAARIGVNTGEDEKVVIPFSQLGKEIKAMDNTLLINVSEDKQGNPRVYTLIDPETGTSDRKEFTIPTGGSGRMLQDLLTVMRLGLDRKAGGSGDNADNEKLQLVIRADREVTFRNLQQVLVAANAAQISKFNLQTTTKAEAQDLGN